MGFSRAPATLVHAVFELLAGRIALSPDIDHALALSRLAGPAAADVLSPREFEVLRLLLAGNTADQIAATLHLSPKTVANTRYLIKGKLGVGSDIELMRLALKQGLLANELAPEASPLRVRNSV